MADLSTYISELYNQEEIQEFLTKTGNDKISTMNPDDAKALLLHVSNASDSTLDQVSSNKVVRFLKRITGSLYLAEEKEMTRFTKNFTSEEGIQDFWATVTEQLFPTDINDNGSLTETAKMLNTKREMRTKERQKEMASVYKEILKNISIKNESAAIKGMYSELTTALKSIEKSNETGKALQIKAEKLLSALTQLHRYINKEASTLVFGSYEEYQSFASELSLNVQSVIGEIQQEALQEARDLLGGGDDSTDDNEINPEETNESDETIE